MNGSPAAFRRWVGSRWRQIEGSRDHFVVVDHGELVVQFVAAGEAGVPTPCCCSGFEVTAQGCSGPHGSISCEPKPEGLWTMQDPIGLRRATDLLIWLGF